jgi:hypothetical protein
VQVLIRSSGLTAQFVWGNWQIGQMAGDKLVIGGQQVVGARAAAVPLPSGGAVVDVEARAAISALVSRLKGHGLIA